MIIMDNDKTFCMRNIYNYSTNWDKDGDRDRDGYMDRDKDRNRDGIIDRDRNNKYIILICLLSS